MVAGSLSICVSTESISGTSRRISASSAVTKPCASRSVMFLVDFDVQLDAQASVVRLDAELVHAETLLRAATARTRSKMLSAWASRGTVWMTTSAAGQRAMHGSGSRLHQFAGVLKGEAPRQRQRQVGKVAGAGAPHARLLHGQHAFHLLHFAHQPAPRLRRNLVHQARPPLRGPAATSCAES